MIGKAKSQLSILDNAFNRRKKLSRTDELLRSIDKFVDWQRLEKEIEPLFKPTKRGRPSIPIIYMLKILFLQSLYNLSDPAMEDALVDRLSFQRFVGFGFDEEIPDFTTIWRFRERLQKSDSHKRIFKIILSMLEEKGFILRKGTLIDATIVQSSRRQNKAEVDKQSPQKDKDAHSARKGDKYFYGYKGHVGVDYGSQIIRKAEFTPANVHDSSMYDVLLSGDERSVFADKAYSKQSRKKALRENEIYCGILDKANRSSALGLKQKSRNKKKSRVRNSVERVFAQFKRIYGYRQVRYLTLKRNEFQFMLLCSLYNIRRGLVLTPQV